jgi:ATP-binding cassette subfamily C protein CydD
MAAHRFHTLALADHIVVLEQGRVVEQGNRVDLLAREGEFARHVRAHAMPGGFQ